MPPLHLDILASGSKGNCACLSAGETTALIDCGISYTATVRRLAERGIKACDIDLIILTHDHSDHIKGLARWHNQHPELPVFASKETGKVVQSEHEHLDVRPLRAGLIHSVGGLEVLPFAVSHDASGPLGFRIMKSDVELGFATDLGRYDRRVVEALIGVDALVLEANHDEMLLARGPYPAFLKRRIGGTRGHLSNLQARSLLEDVLHDDLSNVILAHMSDTNNETLLARDTMAAALVGMNTQISVASQHGAKTLEIHGSAPAANSQLTLL